MISVYISSFPLGAQEFYRAALEQQCFFLLYPVFNNGSTKNLVHQVL